VKTSTEKKKVNIGMIDDEKILNILWPRFTIAFHWIL